MSISVRFALGLSAIFLATSITAAAMFSTGQRPVSESLAAEAASETPLAPIFVTPIDLESCDSPAEL